MAALDITRCIGVPHLTLDNFECEEPDSRYILTSPRSLEACERCGIRPVELLRTPVQDFYDEYKDRDYLSRSEILEAFHLQEKVRLAKLSQAREERQRIIYVEAEEESSKIPTFLEKHEPLISQSSPDLSNRSRSPKRKQKSPVRAAWNNSTKGANMALRSSTDIMDKISISPTKTQKSWVESLRSSSDNSPSTSTPLRKTVSHDNVSVIGHKSCLKKRNRPPARSSSLPRHTSGSLYTRSEPSLTRSTNHVSNEQLECSYDTLVQSHRDLTSNVAELENELKTLKLQQRKEDAVRRKKANIEAMKLRKQSENAASRVRHSHSKMLHTAANMRSAADYAELRRRHTAPSSRAHLLRQTQAHINELKDEIKQYKIQRSNRILQEERESWEALITARQSRSLQRADIKAKRHVRDKSAKAKRMRQEKERLHRQNMKNLIRMEELNLLKNLDTIISKDKKSSYLEQEKELMIKKCRESSRRSFSARSKNNKTFDKMSREAELMAHLEAKGTASRWK